MGVTEVVSVVEAEVAVTVVDEAEVEAEVEEEWEEGRKFTLRPIAMKECSLPEEKRMFLSQRTWPSETLSMVKSALLLRKKDKKKSSTVFGTLSAQSWLQLSWVVLTRSTCLLAAKFFI